MPITTRSQKGALKEGLTEAAAPKRKRSNSSAEPSSGDQHPPPSLTTTRRMTRASSAALSQASEADAQPPPPAKRARTQTPSRAVSAAPSQASNATSKQSKKTANKKGKKPASQKPKKGKKTASRATSVAESEADEPETALEPEYEPKPQPFKYDLAALRRRSSTTPSSEGTKQKRETLRTGLRDHFHKIEIQRILQKERDEAAAKEAEEAQAAAENAVEQLATPVQAAVEQIATPPQPSAQTPVAPPSFFGRIYQTIASPFRTPVPAPQPPAHELQKKVFQLQKQLEEARSPAQAQPEPQQTIEEQMDQHVREEDTSVVTLIPTYAQPPDSPEPSRPQSSHKRKRSATEIDHMPTINESPEINLSTIVENPGNGLIPRSAQTPIRTRTSYKVRRAARDAREAALLATPGHTPMRPRHQPLTPIDSNADRRNTRITGFARLQAAKKEADERSAALAENEPPRKTKRVKVWHLTEIPHCRPGAPTGSFEMPELDSDDEMEVDADAEVAKNSFDWYNDPIVRARKPDFAVPDDSGSDTEDEDAEPILKTPKQSTTMPSRESPSRQTATPASSFAQFKPQTQPQVITIPDDTPALSSGSDTPSEIDFDAGWPYLEPRDPKEPEVSEEYKEAAYQDFERDFNHWLAAGELPDL